MDISTLRSIVTVLAFVCFVGIVWWAYHRDSRRRFDEAAQLPFADDDLPTPALSPAPLPQGEREGSSCGRRARPQEDDK